MEKAKTDIERFKAITFLLGFPPHYDLEVPVMRHIIEHYDEKGLEETKELYEKYMLQKFDDEFMQVILSKWGKMDWINPRFPILKEAIEIHLLDKFYASISTFMPQLEGLIAEQYHTSGRLTQNALKAYIKSLLDGDGSFNFDEAVQKFYLEIVLENFEYGSPQTYDLSRHSISHGFDKDFGIKLNSLKTILLIDYIIDKLNQIK